MHELGVVFHVIDTIKDVAAEQEISHVESITLRLGTVSTVVPEYLEDCWKWASAREDLVRDCRLIIEPVQAITYCEDCKEQYDTIRFGRVCPNCGSENTYLLQGDEFVIKEISV